MTHSKNPISNHRKDTVKEKRRSHKPTPHPHQRAYSDACNDACNDMIYEILDAVPASIYWKDKNGKYLGCNKYMLDMTGINDRSKIIGKDDSELIWHAIAKELQDNDRYVIQNNTTQTFEEASTLANKKDKRTFITTKTPFRNKHGEILGVIGISADITEHKSSEAPRLRHEATERAVKFANMIAGSVAHELRTPLAIIGMQMDLLDMINASNKKTPQEKTQFYQELSTTVKRVVKGAVYVIDSLLTKLKCLAVGGKNFIPATKSQFKRLSIIEGIEDVLHIYPFQDGERELIKFDKSNGFDYWGNKNLSQHAISNLIKNALRAVKETDKRCAITIRLENGKERNSLIIMDNATGMSAEEAKNVFEQFAMALPKSDNGSGLGLSFCKIVMRSYGGDITCRTKPGEYTEFTLTFPKLAK
jgi:two-component system, OmpR family, aerobic respiration control sensor histidine kinase ArcB